MNRFQLRIGDNLEPLLLRSIGAAEVERYAEASGDHNPIHLSSVAAEAAGLDGPVVHGMFIMGQFERLLHRWQSGCTIATLTARFLRPVPVGDSLEVGARIVSIVSDQFCKLRLLARNSAGQLVAMGEATVGLL
ncbi:MAG TPA: MaoC family dehydratase [Aestuariivirgaceae bacterium]|nr:MaoC family dehydratase [Aestuariivirgaceae bacterium]